MISISKSHCNKSFYLYRQGFVSNRYNTVEERVKMHCIRKHNSSTQRKTTNNGIVHVVPFVISNILWCIEHESNTFLSQM